MGDRILSKNIISGGRENAEQRRPGGGRKRIGLTA